MGEMVSGLMAVIAFVLALSLFIWLCFILPARMARKRGRNVAGWIVLFWILSPFWGIILLLILGDSSEKIRNDILNELKNK